MVEPVDAGLINPRAKPGWKVSMSFGGLISTGGNTSSKLLMLQSMYLEEVRLTATADRNSAGNHDKVSRCC